MGNSNQSKPVSNQDKQKYSVEACQQLKDDITSYNETITH